MKLRGFDVYAFAASEKGTMDYIIHKIYSISFCSSL